MNPNPYDPPKSDPDPHSEPPMLAMLVGEDGGMSVNFAVELNDVIDFSVYHSMHSAWGKSIFRKRWLLISFTATLLLVGLTYLVYVQSMLDLVPMWVVVVSAAVATIILYPWIYARRLRIAASAMVRSGRNIAIFGPRRITLTPQLLVHSSPYTQSATRWIAIERVDSQLQALYLYVSSTQHTSSLAGRFPPRIIFRNSFTRPRSFTPKRWQPRIPFAPPSEPPHFLVSPENPRL